jgi:choline dehydrogenase-like flavoprotein
VSPANGELAPGAQIITDADLEKFIRDTSVSTAHQQGTAAMRPLDDQGVVSPTLEVYGVQRLRVCDASIHPLYVDQHPTAAIYMVAEKAAQMIKDKYV